MKLYRHEHVGASIVLLVLTAGAFAACRQDVGDGTRNSDAPRRNERSPAPSPHRDRSLRVVHLFVALCDNVYQGIAPVRASLGNGQDPDRNLYWGAMYGVKTFFGKSPHWEVVACETAPRAKGVLERKLFRLAGADLLLVADAYDGREIRSAIRDFLDASAGLAPETVSCKLRDRAIDAAIYGSADLVCYIGHNGLMDFNLESYPSREGSGGPSRAVVLACKSRDYFAKPLAQAGCAPLIMTSGLMAPEAYLLDAILRAWAAGKKPSEIRDDAAQAYATYQKCPLKSAQSLFVAGEER